MENNSKIINVLWKGPFSIDDVIKNKSENDDFGLYQIYGTHPIYGRNVLLYIGKTQDSFSKRFKSHNNLWIKYEYDIVQIYLGEIKNHDKDFLINEDLTEAENLLLYYCAPAYNSYSITDYRNTKEIVLRNFGKICSIPPELSSSMYNSVMWESEYFNK